MFRDAGLIFLQLGYPTARLRAAITRSSYTHLGFYVRDSEAIIVTLVDVYGGILTPSWYRQAFSLEELHRDKLVERVDIKPYTGPFRAFQEAITILLPLIPKYNLEDFMRQSLQETVILRDWDIIGTLIDYLEKGSPVTLVPREFNEQSLLSNSRLFQSLVTWPVPSHSASAILAETESALFMERNILRKLTEVLLKLLEVDGTFRRDLARQMLIPKEPSSVCDPILEGKLRQLLHLWDRAFVTGELRRQFLLASLEDINQHLQEPCTLPNLAQATTITLDEVSGSREGALRKLHQLTAEVQRQCQTGELVHFSLPTLISAVNQLCSGCPEYPHIPTITEGSYGAVLEGLETEEVYVFPLDHRQIHLIPTHNAYVEHLKTEELTALAHLLNEKRYRKLTGLRSKVATALAQRRKD